RVRARSRRRMGHPAGIPRPASLAAGLGRGRRGGYGAHHRAAVRGDARAPRRRTGSGAGTDEAVSAMRWIDFLHLALRSVTAHRMRSGLTLGGIAVGIAAVILLTSIGEGLHRFVLQEFGQFGTNVIEITPGRQGPRGGPPGLP